MVRALSLALPVVLAPGLGAGCELSGAPEGWRDTPIRVARDCSFIDAGAFYGVAVSGGPVGDIGGGRIGQRITALGGCAVVEDLIFVDCNSGEGIWIAGRDYGDDLQGGRDADALYPPQGALRLTPQSTIADLEALAMREGYVYRRDLSAFLDEFIGDDGPDSACGCRIFYPDSAQATQ